MAVALPALISVASGSFGAAVGTLAAGGAGFGATLGAFATVAGTVLTGIGALAEHTALTPPVLVAVLIGWTAAPLALAALVFSRREL